MVETMFQDQQKALSQEQLRMIRKWRGNPAYFFKHVLGWEPWEKQEEILKSLLENKETYVQSCNAAGNVIRRRMEGKDGR